MPRATPLEQWRVGRTEVAAALRETPLDHEFPWYGSQLTPALMIPLRLMETWAHGQGIYDAVDVPHPPANRLRHVAALGVIGRELSFHTVQLPPSGPLLPRDPDDQTWTWGPENAEQQVHGSAADFCLRVTRRRSLEETELVAVGEDARTWLEVARVFL
ncbi:maleylpyruvate isomerase family mycothiol-dependent enzyme [Streptomyces acidiscabies]|uniref:maleylpyruvate isomerase family mycothiol-dependent enzyme n=1 Tax=Streptomyces acidiscabies TaxID=42234 RepID=UPI00067E644E|nr:maleylpyruvate isomerase family mycothiol-dependent enzyme [Streptomyces acidiscabies]